MAKKVITCITCPIGCEITVEGEGERVVSMTGQQCKRGETYARNEFIHPVRILTSTIKLEGADVPLVAVRSRSPVPKELLLPCMEEIKRAVAKPPIAIGDVLIPNVLETGVDIVASGEV